VQNTVSECLSKVLPAVDSIRDWDPALGNVYKKPPQPETDDSKLAKATPGTGKKKKNAALDAAINAAREEAFFVHQKYGGDYMDEKVVTGEPGNFKFTYVKPSSTAAGRQHPAGAGTAASGNEVLPKAGSETPATAEGAGAKADEKKGAKGGKSPKTPHMPKPKRRKSKGGPASATS
jgi:mediator of RNA polymerase II transcription subunit 6